MEENKRTYNQIYYDEHREELLKNQNAYYHKNKGKILKSLAVKYQKTITRKSRDGDEEEEVHFLEDDFGVWIGGKKIQQF